MNPELFGFVGLNFRRRAVWRAGAGGGAASCSRAAGRVLLGMAEAGAHASVIICVLPASWAPCWVSAVETATLHAARQSVTLRE
jgi:hypothetical protein